MYREYLKLHLHIKFVVLRSFFLNLTKVRLMFCNKRSQGQGQYIVPSDKVLISLFCSECDTKTYQYASAFNSYIFTCNVSWSIDFDWIASFMFWYLHVLMIFDFLTVRSSLLKYIQNLKFLGQCTLHYVTF
jgi:hypothetical protein